MIIGRSRFNIYLLAALTALLAGGCASHEKDKEPLATFRVHLEALPDAADRTTTAQVHRSQPVTVTLEREPFLSEVNIAEAKVVDVVGGFDLQIQFDRQGTWLLQNYSASHPGKHFAVFSQFGEEGKQSRWLAAPSFGKAISNGILQFAPDATREECEQIVTGLNNVAKRVKKNSKW